MNVISNSVYDAKEAGFHIFGIHGVNKDGACECENPECTAFYKHPKIQNWQAVPEWSQEQFEVMCEMGHFSTGYGLLTKDIMVVDVDARNGGVDSFKRLCDDIGIDLYNLSSYVVTTGSGGGSMHVYFSAPKPPKALMQTIDKYKGIDFKCNSGFVIGAGSKHKSGDFYEVDKGFPQDLVELPQALVDLLEKKTQYRATDLDGTAVDIEVEELRNVVSHINNGSDYFDWLNVGMAIHDTTQGSMQGLTIWDEWSSKFEGYEEGCTAKKWSGFGKGQSLVSLGTLIHLAKQGGYVQPVTFNADVYVKEDEPIDDLDAMVDHIDIRRPHGFVGKVCEYINSQCLYPRENLAAGAAIYVISCLAGMRTKDVDFGINANFMMFGVAGSGSGKESIYKGVLQCLQAAGVMPAVHGKFKSEQESMRNLLRHQASFYTIDEMGIELTKISNAAKRGGAAYMEGLIGLIMSAYSKADGVLPVSGDMKEGIKDSIHDELKRIEKLMDKDGEEKHINAYNQVLEQLKSADDGIVNPYVTLMGTTTPSTFYGLVDEDMATNGFIARTSIFKEKEDNPRWKNNFKPTQMSMPIQLCLSQLYNGGEYNNEVKRVCKIGNDINVTTNDDAKEMLFKIREYFYELAESQKETKNLIPIPRRGFEMVLKISLILAIPTGVRTIQDVLYAFKVAKDDIDFKIDLANSNRESKDTKENGDILLSAILTKLDKEHSITIGQVRNKIKKFTKEQIDEGITHLVNTNKIIKFEEVNELNRKTTVKLLLA